MADDIDDFFKEIEELEAKGGDEESTPSTSKAKPAARKAGGADTNPRPAKKARASSGGGGGGGVVAITKAPQHRLTVKDPLAPKHNPYAGYNGGVLLPESYGVPPAPAALAAPSAAAAGAQADPIAQQQSVYSYDPSAYRRAKEREHEDVRARPVVGGSSGGGERKQSAAASLMARLNKNSAAAPKKFVRSAAGEVWVDKSLAEWPEGDFRLFVGDIGNECTDEVLAQAFRRYKSFAMAKVVMDKVSKKTRGYGFVSFMDPHDATQAMKEMNGKYVANRPIKLRKSKWNERELANTQAQRKAYQKLQKKLRRLATKGY